MLVPYEFSGSGSADFEEIDVTQYFGSSYGTPNVRLMRYGRISCLSFVLSPTTPWSISSSYKYVDVIQPTSSIGGMDSTIGKKISPMTKRVDIGSSIHYHYFVNSNIDSVMANFSYSNVVATMIPDMGYGGFVVRMNSVDGTAVNNANPMIQTSIMFLNRFDG